MSTMIPNLIEYIVTELNRLTNSEPLNYLSLNRTIWLNERVTKELLDIIQAFDLSNTNISPFEKDVLLKFELNNQIKNLNDTTRRRQLDKWIVCSWGGISTHRDFESIYDLKTQRLYDRISSWSKILSFENIETDIIYDSRVIYSLNWLIYKYNKLHGTNKKFLFQPDGRNKKLNLLPVEAIINFEYSSHYDLDKRGDKVFCEYFCDKNECYEYARKLIFEINQKLFENVKSTHIGDRAILHKNFPFFSEMILFEIANKEIFEDIRKLITVSINEI
ncbi:hypothetical protein [Sulfurospirillum sp. UCH001]|uniref:hypothetical protein n=1 Tax=Sulfurospirillum sp. UCH001 TaxID=1581011 RepID=UPI000833165D|nr:hypothetical protein [Sulfurospirillum sp. UCH001]